MMFDDRPAPASFVSCAPAGEAAGAAHAQAGLARCFDAELLKGWCIVLFALAGNGYVVALGFIYVLPPLAPVRYGRPWWLHVGGFGYLAANFFYNYFSCLCTNPGTHDSPAFHRLVQAGRLQGLVPAKDGGEAASGGGGGGGGESEGMLEEGDRGGWLLREPFAWGWCEKSRRPKPPRAHFCRATNRQVLAMDHYCAW